MRTDEYGNRKSDGSYRPIFRAVCNAPPRHRVEDRLFLRKASNCFNI